MTGEKISIYLSEMWKTLKWIQARAIAFQREKKLIISESFLSTSGTSYTREEILKEKTKKYYPSK